jgi:deoxyribose-phosphate aldolase
MEVPKPTPLAAPTTYQQLAQAIDFHLLDPALTEEQLYEGCRWARNWKVGTVVVRPSDVDLAIRWLRADGSDLRVAGTVSFPHGASTTSTKLYETHDVLRRGANEVEVVMNLGKIAARHFQYTEYEFLQLAEACHKAGAKIKAIFDTPLMTDEAKIVCAKICKRSSVDFASIATGYAGAGWSARDLDILLWKCAPFTEVKATGIPNLEEALAVYQAGVTRIGTRWPEVILEAWEKHLAAQEASAALPS